MVLRLRAPASAALALALSTFAVAACDDRGAAGAERGDCRPDGKCDPGLVCLSKLCVRPPPADCRAVGESLASIELGNYASPEERAPVVERQRAACERAFVGKEEGACLEAARDVWTAEGCAPRMFAGSAQGDAASCGRIAEKLRVQGEVPPQQRAWIEMIVRVIGESCREDRWPRALIACALDRAQPGDVYISACSPHAPRALWERISTKIANATRTQMQ